MSRTANNKRPAGNSKAAAAERERLFVEGLFANRMNGTKAAIAAGFSERTAAQKAQQLLTRPSVKIMLRERQDAMAKRFDLTSESVIAELSKIVHADPRKLFGEDGRMIHPKEWPDDMAGVVASLEVVEEFEGHGQDRKLIGYTKKIKLWDKNSAIEKAMKHLGLFAEDNKQRASALSELPREMVKAIVDRLKQLNGQSPRLD